MVCITFENYLKYMSMIKFKEETEEYKIEKYSKNKIYNEKRTKELSQRHDKMFKDVLGNKKEIAKFLKDFIGIKEEMLLECPTQFITKTYEERRSDIIYKIEKEPIYFLIEHQSTVDKNMLERIGEYVGQIMQKGVKEGTYPIVVPIVIYTGKQKWNVKTKFSDKQYKKENYEEYEINLKYNLIKAEDYTKEELLKKESLFAYIMIIEKSMKTKEIADNLFKIAKKIKQEDDKELFKKIARNVLRPEIGEKQTKELIKKIDGKHPVINEK